MGNEWLLLVLSLPTRNSSGRMRAWRALKALGCGVLRDGAYVLPDRPGLHQALQAQADAVINGGGNAQVLRVRNTSDAQHHGFIAMFDRSGAYTKLLADIRQTALDVQSRDITWLQRQCAQLRKEFAGVSAVDFFPGTAQAQTAAMLEDLQLAVSSRAAPDEPHAVQKRIERLRIPDYRGRVWATRRRPWVDRLASAWLIRRFIDPEARFIWLAAPDACPSTALGFDFDGAAFTHVGAKVTFEVLLASFGLLPDAALNRLGSIVHYLDAGGIPAPEAAGLEPLLNGMQQRWPDDDALLVEVEKIFDAFYQAFAGTEP